ncbi:hypothetical protein CsSME_00011718 [Camellia sinensis var. sinensis]
MPTNSENEDRQSENGAHVIPPSTVYSQPWWRVTGTNGMPSPVEHINGSATGRAMSQANGDASNKEAHTINAQQSGIYAFILLMLCVLSYGGTDYLVNTIV